MSLTVSRREAPGGGYWSWWLALFVLLWVAAVLLALAEPARALAEQWALVPVGALGALLGNVTAVGGGLIFIPYTMLVGSLEPVASLKLALSAQAFGMTSGALAWTARGWLPRRLFAATAPVAVLGALVATVAVAPSPGLVKGLFGPVSIAIGLSVLLLAAPERPRDELPRRVAPGILVAALLGGVVTAWVAIGVGEVVAAVLILGHRQRPERAIALGVALLAVCSIALTGYHAVTTGGIPWEMTAFLVLGVVFGARLAPFVAARLGAERVQRTFALVAIADGLLFVFQAWRG